MDFKAFSTAAFYGRRFENLPNALNAIEEDKSNAIFDIAIIPPDADFNIDQEDIDTESLDSNHIPNDVPGNVEVLIRDDDFKSEDEVPLSEISASIRRESQTHPLWSESCVDMTMYHSNVFELKTKNMKAVLENKSPVEIFETLFDNDVMELILDQSRLYASQHNDHTFHFNKEVLEIFIGILFYSGYYLMPRGSMYWKLDEDTRTALVANNMSRNRFFEIKKYMHFAVNCHLVTQDKMAKLTPLMNLLSKKYQLWGFMHEKLSIDEAMIRYFGHHSSKQFTRGKPCRFGFKNWILTNSCGYLYSFDTYCGAKNCESRNKSHATGIKSCT